MKNSKSNKLVINMIVIVLMQVLSFVYSLISKRIFLDNYSISSYGVIDLFGSFFSSLTLLELGFGTILIYNLYKPLANNNREAIIKQLSIFKTIYAVISLIVLTIALGTLPFVYDIFNIDCNNNFLVYEIYIFNIIHILVKYYLLNKISLIRASEYGYVENIIFLISDFIGFSFRMISLLVFKSENLYVASLLFSPILIYLMDALWVNKKYKISKIKFASFKTILDSGVLRQCRKYIYASLYMLVFYSMDNIIISMKLSTNIIAYITNYASLFAIGKEFVSTVVQSTKGLMADYYNKSDSIDNFYNIFNFSSSFIFVLSSLVSVGFYTMIDNFISLWIGEQYLISRSIVFILLLNVLVDILFSIVESVFVIKGYIFEEKLPLIFSALTNLILTIVLLNRFGLIGAYIATFIALLIKWFGKFYYVLKDIFYNYRYKILSKYLLFFIIILVEMILGDIILDTIFIHVSSIYTFILKFIVVCLSLVTINGLIIMLDKSVRNYLKQYISMLRR